MLPKFRDEGGGLPVRTIAVLAVLAVLVLSLLMFRPIAAKHTTLEDSLGSDIQTEILPL